MKIVSQVFKGSYNLILGGYSGYGLYGDTLRIN